MIAAALTIVLGVAIFAIAVLAVRRFKAVNATFNFIVEPLGPTPGEYVPKFPEIDALTQDIPQWTRHLRCLRCEIAPVPADGPTVFCDPCRSIIAALQPEPIEQEIGR